MTVDTRRLPPTRQLVDTGLVAILRAPAADHLGDVAETLVAGGVTCLEITLNTPGALDALRRIRRRLPSGVAVGVGTATSAGQVEAAHAAGAGFVVSPNVDPAVIARCADLGLPCYPGAFTPTEVVSAWRAGATAVKVFPAGVCGPEYLRQVRAPLPEIPLVPTGGVRIDDIPEYLTAGALAVGLGGPLLGDALTGGDLAALGERARRAVDLVATARRERM